MKERPVLFNTEMVRATLKDRKTQTRRLEGLEELNKNPNPYHLFSPTATFNGSFLFCAQRDEGDLNIKCPYGKPGDRLWVRETFKTLCPFSEDESIVRAIEYKATNRLNTQIIYTPPLAEDEGCLLEATSKWKPSIHMFKKYARIWLEITDIRAERVQEISTNDIEAEGVKFDKGPREVFFDGAAYVAFQKLWNSINEKRGYSWESNPWVWVIEFKKVK